MLTRKYGAACAACRGAKVKCTWAGANSSTCNRCLRSGRPCDRNRPSRHRITNRVDAASRTFGNVHRFDDQLADQHNPKIPNELDSGCNSQKSTATNTTPNDLDKDDGCESDKLGSVPILASAVTDEKNHLAFTLPSFVLRSDDTRNLSLYSALSPTRHLQEPAPANPSEEGGASQGEASPPDDPITMLILNRPSAEHLLEGYFAHFEYNVGFLDPILYTFDYIRVSSAFLFTTLLSISSRVFRPDLYKALRSHAEILLSRVLLSCDAEIENIWAIVCMYYWKEVADTRGYTMIGFAMRLAASSQWNASRRGTQGLQNHNATESQVRKQRDQDRIWLYLSSLDRTLSLFTDRPLSSLVIPQEISSRNWLRTNPCWTYGFGDARALAGEELNILVKPLHGVLSASRGKNTLQNISTLTTTMKTFDTKMIAWADYWAPVFASFEHTVHSLEPQIHMYCNHVRTYFNAVLLHRTMSATDSITNTSVTAAVKNCYDTALTTLKQAISFGRTEILYYLWDTAHLMIAYTAMVLLKVIQHAPVCPVISVTDAFNVLRELTDMHSMGAEAFALGQSGQSDRQNLPGSTIEAQSRLLKAVLFRLKADSMLWQRSFSVGGQDNDESNNNEDAQVLSEMQLSLLHPEGPTVQGTAHQVEWLQVTDAIGLLNAEVLAGEVDFLIDSEFESWFTGPRLLPWNTPGNFKDPK